MSIVGKPEDLGPLALLLQNPMILVDGLDNALAKLENGLIGPQGVLSIVRVPSIIKYIDEAL